MEIIKFNVPLIFGKKRFLEPGVRYVMGSGDAKRISEKVINQGGMFLHSNFNSYERRYAPGNVKAGDRIAIYRHNAFGDQLIVTGLARYLNHIHPDCFIDVYCMPEVSGVWLGNKTVANVLPGPPTFEALGKEYTQHHIILDAMLEENREADQQNCYDDMFEWCGLMDVPDEFKRPHVVVREGTEDERLGLLWMGGTKQNYLVYQLGAGGQTRTYPPELGATLINKWMVRHPEWAAVLVGLSDRKERGGRDEAAILREGISPDFTCHDFIDKTKSWRELTGLVANADAAVCPDSSIGHLAGAFPDGPKVVSLWGVMHPDDRVKYYENHFPLTGDTCPHFPCRRHVRTLPRELCADAPNEDPVEGRSLDYCNALRGIEPEMIVERLEEITKTQKK